MLPPGAPSSKPASGFSSDESPSFPVSSGQLSSQPTHPPPDSASDLLHSFEANESEQITGILVGLMAPPQYPVRPRAQQLQVDRECDLPSSSPGDPRTASAMPFPSASFSQGLHPHIRQPHLSGQALDTSSLQWPPCEDATATGNPTFGQVFTSAPWRHTPSLATRTPPTGSWSPRMTPETRWRPEWPPTGPVDMGPGPAYTNHAPLPRSIRPIDSYRPASRAQAAAILGPSPSIISSAEARFPARATPSFDMQPPSAPASQSVAAHQQYTYRSLGPHAWPSTPGPAPTPIRHPTPSPFSRVQGSLPGDSQPAPANAADLYLRGAQAKEKGADRVLNALNNMAESLFNRMDQMKDEIRAEAKSEMQAVRDQLHALSVGQRTLATREEVAEEITSQLSPALSDFSQSMTRRTDQACAQLSQSVTESFTEKLRVVIAEVQASDARRFEQANAAEKPLVELMSHLVNQLGNIESIASSLQGLTDLPRALSDMSVFRVALDALTDKSNRLTTAPAALAPQDRAIQASASATPPRPDGIVPMLEQLKTGLSSQDSTIADILQYMSGLAQEATELRSTLGAVLNVMEELSGAKDRAVASAAHELEVITPRAAPTPSLPTPVTSGPNTTTRLPQIPPQPSETQRSRARGQTTRTPSNENGSISRKSSTESSSTSDSADVFGPKRAILKFKSLNLADASGSGDLQPGSAAEAEDAHHTRSKSLFRPVLGSPPEAAGMLAPPPPASGPSRSKAKPKSAPRKRSATTAGPKPPAAKRKRASPTALGPAAGEASLADPACLTAELRSLTPNKTRDTPIEVNSSDSLPSTVSPPPDAFVRRSTRAPSGSTDDPFGRGGDNRTDIGSTAWRR